MVWRSNDLFGMGVLRTLRSGRGVQRGDKRGGFLTYFCATSFSPAFDATLKIVSPTSNFEAPSLDESWMILSFIWQ